LLHVVENGASAEISVVGREGILGVSVFMGGASTPSRAVVQIAGYAYLLKSEILKEVINSHGPLMLIGHTSNV
jgi:hypothetical protein